MPLSFRPAIDFLRNEIAFNLGPISPEISTRPAGYRRMADEGGEGGLILCGQTNENDGTEHLHRKPRFRENSFRRSVTLDARALDRLEDSIPCFFLKNYCFRA